MLVKNLNRFFFSRIFLLKNHCIDNVSILYSQLAAVHMKNLHGSLCLSPSSVLFVVVEDRHPPTGVGSARNPLVLNLVFAVGGIIGYGRDDQVSMAKCVWTAG